MNKELLGIIITAAAILVGAIIGSYIASKILTNQLHESLKKIGFKILAIFAMFNIFNDSSSEMQDNDNINNS